MRAANLTHQLWPSCAAVAAVLAANKNLRPAARIAAAKAQQKRSGAIARRALNPPFAENLPLLACSATARDLLRLPLQQRLCAVDPDFRPRDMARSIRREEQHQIGDLFRAAGFATRQRDVAL